MTASCVLARSSQRIEQDPLCLFDMHGELKAFLEAFLWVGIDAGFFEVTLFEARERFVDEIIASFDHECPPIAPPVSSRIEAGSTTIELLRRREWDGD